MYYLSPQCISSMCLGLHVVARGRPPMPLRSMFTILLRVVLTPFARRVAIADDGPYLLGVVASVRFTPASAALSSNTPPP
jgi:hypothetical protein